MAENREFISAKDLPTTEAEEVDVLCVDPVTGELVKKPGANLGGGGGYMMKPTADELSFDDSDGHPTITATTNADELAKALEAGSSASIVIPAGFWGESDPAVVVNVIGWFYREGMGLACFVMNLGDFMMVAFTNCTYIPNLE